jgi:hypothetical protein
VFVLQVTGFQPKRFIVGYMTQDLSGDLQEVICITCLGSCFLQVLVVTGFKTVTWFLLCSFTTKEHMHRPV